MTLTTKGKLTVEQRLQKSINLLGNANPDALINARQLKLTLESLLTGEGYHDKTGSIEVIIK